MRKAIVISVLLISLAAGSLFAIGEARFRGKIVDPQGNPIPGATVTVVAVESKTFKQTYTADKSGTVTFILLDGTIKYKMTFAKEGLAPYEETVKLKLMPEQNERTITLGGAAASTTVTITEPTKPDLATAAYNDGAAAANAGDVDAAIVKFEEAVTLKPDLTAGHMALTKMYAKKNDWKKVIERGTKVLEIVGEDDDTFALLAQAYAKTGDKAKAAEFRNKAPADPAALFNEAARHINAGKDKEAEPLLQRAVAADDSFAPGHYELGMIYARTGKNAEARKHLLKYLELEPSGKDASTAKEMLNYVK